MRTILAALATLAPAAVPMAALAHNGDHGHAAPTQALQHLLSQPDHLLAIAGIVLALSSGSWVLKRALVRK